MALPTQTDAFYITLDLFRDDKPHTRKEIIKIAVNALNLTPDDLKLRTKSGKPIYESRLSWGVSYLERAGMLKKIKRGVYEITDRGQEYLRKGQGGKAFSEKLNKIIESENPWNRSGGDTDNPASEDSSNLLVNDTVQDDKSPQETIEQAVYSLRQSLASELLDMILEQDAYCFERIVVKLLEAMGYGTGKVTPKSGDAGIDGIITADPLGFDMIYTQAKRYSPSNRVGTPEMQGFVGALGDVTKGVFITTSSFQPAAIQIAKNWHHAKIELIDGERLIDLMIDYNVGVTVEESFEIKRVDLDFFDEMA